MLKQYHWPENVRKLQNIVERMISMADSNTIHLEYLPEDIVHHKDRAVAPSQSKTTQDPCERVKIKQNLSDKERQYIIDFLIKARDNISLVAKEMGIARSTIYRKMRQYNIYY